MQLGQLPYVAFGMSFGNAQLTPYNRKANDADAIKIPTLKQ